MQFGEVKELIAIFEKTDLNDMEVQLDNAVVCLNRGRAVPVQPVPLHTMPVQAMPPVPPVMPPVPPAPSVQAQGPEAVFKAGMPSGESSVPLSKGEIDNLLDSVPSDKKAAKEDNAAGSGKFIKAPIVGTFYQSASPEKPPYVNIGDTVSKGDIVCIIEAMKFMNEVTSEESGKITEILVEDGQFVEFGEPLFKLG